MTTILVVSAKAEQYKTFIKNAKIDANVVNSNLNLESTINIIKKLEPDVMVLDLCCSSVDWGKIIKYVKSISIPCRVIVLCIKNSIRLATEALRSGAFALLEEPVNEALFIKTVESAIKHHRKTDKLFHNFHSNLNDSFEGFIGTSSLMQNLYAKIEAVADSTAPVFIIGESGTGKELCAEALHKRSLRSIEPFVVLNCSAIPKELMESEIFGHVKGAFTGASFDRAGAALSANKGTLFLDEICDLSLSLQAKLLRFLQTMKFRPLGSDDEKEVDVRIISASNKNPWEEVKKGNFREDLYYRLYVFEIHIPPLRERGNDVILIAEYLLDKYSLEENKIFKGFAKSAKTFLLSYSWPGNIRQLQNVIRSTVLSENTPLISKKMLKQYVKDQIFENKPNKENNTERNDFSLEEIETKAINTTLQKYNGNVYKTAKALKISPSTIYRKQQKIKTSSH